MIGLLMLAAASVSMDAATESDFVCAQVTARASKATSAPDDRTSYEKAHAYYLGRLTARVHAVRWEVRWEDRINEALSAQPLSEYQYHIELQRCVDYYIDELPDLAPK